MAEPNPSKPLGAFPVLPVATLVDPCRPGDGRDGDTADEVDADGGSGILGDGGDPRVEPDDPQNKSPLGGVESSSLWGESVDPEGETSGDGVDTVSGDDGPDGETVSGGTGPVLLHPPIEELDELGELDELTIEDVLGDDDVDPPGDAVDDDAAPSSSSGDDDIETFLAKFNENADQFGTEELDHFLRLFQVLAPEAAIDNVSRFVDTTPSQAYEIAVDLWTTWKVPTPPSPGKSSLTTLEMFKALFPL
jgi:hypothetical protein